MRKEIIKHFIFWVVYFLFLTVVNSLYSFKFWPLYLGGLVGLFMSDLDHILYVFVFKPQELTSQRIMQLVKSKQYKESLRLLYDTKEERGDLIFHTPLFQTIFVILTFWVISSSGSLFARGLVLSYLLGLTIFNFKKYVLKTENYFIWQALALFIFGLLL